MDCEKLDALAIDLVYATEEDGEGTDARAALSELERDAARAHLDGCSRCATMIARLRSGLSAAKELSLVEPSSFLEARILASASASKPVPSVRRRIARAVSTVGGWAMRPQIAMAAVLVMMVGTSVLLLRGTASQARRTKVTDEGQPVATLNLPPALAESQNQGAPAVVGGDKKPAPKEGKAEAPLPPAESEAKEQAKDEEKKKNKQDEEGAKDGKLATMTPGAGMAGPATGGAAAPPAVAAPTAPPPPPADDLAKAQAPAKKSAAAEVSPTPATFDESMTAFKDGRYAAAAKGFEAQAMAGTKPSTSWLYTARSFSALGSCVQALSRFQKVIDAFASSPEVPFAALEGGRCARSMGETATARALLEKAKSYPATQKQAESELAAMSGPAAGTKAKAAKPMGDNGY